MTKKLSYLCAVLICLLSISANAQVQIGWASVVSPNAANAAGPPDGITVGGAAGTSSLGGFGQGAGNSVTYNANGLETLLGVSVSVMAQTNFIAFEGNGTPNNTFETGTWTFSDGTNNFTVTHTFGNTPSQDGAGVLALGNVTPFNYDLFFGAAFPPANGDLAYILFDIPAGVNLNSSNFTATLVSPGDVGSKPGTPDLDAAGTLAVPEPSTLMLIGSGLLLLPLGRRYRHQRLNDDSQA